MNKILINFIFIILFLFTENFVSGQIDNYSLGHNQSVIPPSPTAGELGKYVEIPVSKYTGVANISIPIFEITEGDITLPISISYHSSGIRVQETSSWVGMGWSLNAGGIITRVINDLNDERNDILGKGYLINSTDLWTVIGDQNYEDYVEHNTIWYKHNASKLIDFEPDLFYYNFNGNTGKFLYDRYGKVVPVDQRDIVIEKNIESIDNINYITNFTITLENGIKYFFENYDISYVKTYIRHFSGVSPIYHPIDTDWATLINTNIFSSSWYLTKIQDLSGKEILFTYETEKFLDYSKGNVISKKTGSNDLYSENNPSYIYYTGKRLSRIDWSGGYIVFDATENRKDLGIIEGEESKRAKILTGIRIYNSIDTTPIKNFKLSHSYFYRDPEDNKYWELRLKLESIKELNSNDEGYTFEYYGGLFFNRFSYNTDYWGYFKNCIASYKTNYYIYNSTSDIFPNKYSILSHHGNLEPSEIISDGADRSPYFENTRGGMLKKINYNTGGYSEYIYEPNDFNLEGHNFIGGGLRIKEIKFSKNGEPDSFDIIKKYSYKIGNTEVSSGKIISIPIVALKVPDCNSEYMHGDPIYNTGSFSSLIGTHGSHVGYTEVTEETLSNSGDGTTNGKVISHYSLPAPYGTETADCFTVQGITECVYNKPEAQVLSYYESPLTQHELNVLVSAPVPNYDLNRGLLLNEIYYDNKNKKIKEIINTYNPPETWRSYRKIYGIRTNYTKDYDYELEFNHIPFSRFYFLVNWRYLTETKEIWYNQIDQNKTIEKITNYYYHNPINAPHKFVTEVSTIMPEGKKFSKKYKYPSDYNFTSEELTDYLARDVKMMQIKHNLNKPVEIITKSEDNVLNSTLIDYFGGNYPEQI